MQKSNTFQNIILFLFFCAFIFFAIAMVNSVDRMRFRIEELKTEVTAMQEKMDSLKFTAADVSAEKKQKNLSGANAQYFDSKAEQGGCLFTANSADTGNMNYIVNNEATVAGFWAKTMDALAVRDLQKPEEFVPQMAESWTITPDNMTYRFKLRKGILWHDFKDPVTGREWKNKEVTADDFKFYIDVIKDEKVDAVPLRGYFSGIEKINVINPYEFEVVWNRKYFLSKEISLSLSPLPKHLYHAYPGPFDGTKFNTDDARNRIIVGCGPYQFAGWEKGKRVLFKRFEKYYGKSLGTMPPVKALSFEFIQHPNSRLQALAGGTLDLGGLTAEQWVNQANAKMFGPDGVLNRYRYPAFAYSYIGLNLKNPLFQDRRVRVALSHLIDRDRIQKDVYHDLVRKATGPFFIGGSASDPTVKPDEFSIEKAKKLLADAGWKDTNGDGILDKDGKPFQFTVMYPNINTGYQKLLPIVKEDMAKAGVKLEILALEWTVVVNRIETKNFEASLLGWTSSLSPDPFQLWHSSTVKLDRSSNYISFRNPEADKLIEAIRETFDDGARTKLYHKFHKLIHDEAPYLFLFSPYNLMVVNKRWRNVKVFPLGIDENIMWTPKVTQRVTPGL